MLRKLDEKEIALIRMGIWPCCGEREVQGGPRGGLMRNLRCPNCGTIVNIPAFKTSTEVMFQMCEMVNEPLYYDPEAVMRRLEISHEQIKNINIIMSPAPHEVRLQKKAMRWATIPQSVLWVAGLGIFSIACMSLTYILYPGTGEQRFGAFLVATLLGLAAIVGALWRIERKSFKGKK